MSISLSFKVIVILILCSTMVISGTVLVWKLVEVRTVVNEIPIPGKGELRAEVIPAESQEGTLFFIKAQYFEEREQQDLTLTIQKDNYLQDVNVFDDGNHYDGETGDGVYGGYFNSQGKGTGKYTVKLGQESLTEFIVYKPGCELVQGEYDKTQISFAVIPYGYDDYDEFKADLKYIINGRNSLLETEPFKSNKDKFVFFAVNTTRDLECEIGCRNVPTLVCCNNRIVMEEASRCDYDSVFILVNSKKECGSASYYAKICSKNSYANLVLMHELGHSFGDLADEYVYADYFGDYSVGEVNEFNCATQNCTKWSNITEGCYEGCTYSNLYRPQKSNSIMLDLYPEFNEVCQVRIQDLINNYVLDKNLQETQEKSFFFNLNYDNGRVSFENAVLKPVSSWKDFRKSEYSLVIRGRRGELFNTSLYIPNKIFPIPPNGTLVYEDNVDFSVTFPYYNQAEEVRIYKQDKLVASSEVNVLTDKCGNGICDTGETRKSCPVDCQIKDGFCETSTCDPDCPSQSNCETTNLMIFISTIVLTVGSFLTIIFFIAWMISIKK